jgi:hypothetical protein
VSGRMDWDRVRVEDLSRRHGSEWLSFADSEHSFADLSLESRKSAKSRKNKKKGRRTVVPVAARMVGCSCGKPVGFTGQHKKRCPLCRVQASIAVRREDHRHGQKLEVERKEPPTGNGETEPTYRKLTVKEKQGRVDGLQFEVSEKGGVSVRGLGRFPVTLYYEQWARLLDAAQRLRDFLETNKTKLKLKQ